MMNQRELYEYNRNRRICQICFASDDLEKTLKPLENQGNSKENEYK